MKGTYENNLTYKVDQRIDSLPYNVIMRRDLSDLGGKKQISYAIRQLIKAKKIIRIGYGLYAKTKPSPFSETALLKDPNGFVGTMKEVLNRLNIAWLPSKAVEDYNSGRSTQVPARYIFRLKNRFRRKISYKGMPFMFEKVS